MMENKVKIELKNISKAFGPKIANQHVNLNVYEGEILSLLGENGSGKTTLMNMISGIYYPDEGSIFVDGKQVVIKSPKDAFDLHIGMIHQHFKLIDLFTAADNITLGQKLSYGLKDKINDLKNQIGDDEEKNKQLRKEMFIEPFKALGASLKFNWLSKNRAKSLQHIVDKYGFEIDLSKKIYEMSVSEKQTVEIIKVLYRGANILILDEPTAVLTPQEISKLFTVLRKMKDDGKSIIIITHKLNEVMEISDRVAVLKKGEHVATVNTSETSEQELTDMMVGKKIQLNIKRDDPVDSVDRLFVKNLNAVNREGVKVLDDVSFTVKSGEILGIAGIAGSGQKELLEAIAGLQPLKSGDIVFNRPKKDLPVSFYHKTYSQIVEMAKEGKFHYEDGSTVSFSNMMPSQIKKLVKEGKVLFNDDDVVDLKDKTPEEIREMGVRLSFVPEDRLGMGLVGNMDLIDNMMLRSYRKGPAMLLDRKKPEKLAKDVIESLEVSTPSVHTAVRKLSGGNVQKVLLGREISAAPKVLMAAYPVRGLDINSSYTIYNLLNEQKGKGVAIIFVGEDLDVLLGLCDRILVMCGGKVSGIVDGRTISKEQVGLLMTKVGDEVIAEENNNGNEN